MSDSNKLSRGTKVIVKKSLYPFFERGENSVIEYVYVLGEYNYQIKSRGFGRVSVHEDELEPLEQFDVT